MKIDFQQIMDDFSAKNIIVENDYIIIYGLDGSITKIKIDYIDKKYLIEE